MQFQLRPCLQATLCNFYTSPRQQEGQSRYPVLRVFVPCCACFVSRPLVKGNEDAAYHSPCLVIPNAHCSNDNVELERLPIITDFEILRSHVRACSQILTIGIVLVIAFPVSKDNRIRYPWVSGFWSFCS